MVNMGDWIVWLTATSSLFLNIYAVVTTTETVYGRERGNITLSCSGVVNAAVAWSNRNTEDDIYTPVAYDSDTADPDKYSATYSGSSGVYTFTVHSFIEISDAKYYRCEMSLNGDSQKVVQISIIIPDGPSSASINGNDPVFAADSNSLTLTCNTNTATPGVTYEWGNGETVFPGETDSTLTLSPVEPSHNGADITCTAMNTVYNDIQVTSDPVMLTVYYGPERATITGNAVLYADGNNKLTLTCTAYTVNPGVTFDWSTPGVTGDKSVTSTSTTSSLTITPVWSDNGQTVECIAMNSQFPDRQKTDTMTLIIHYGPTGVHITGNNPVYADGSNQLTLTCTAEQYNPGAVYQWREGQTILTGQNTDPTYSVYTKTATRNDNGRNIRCLAWNSDHTNRQQETSEILIVFYDPFSDPTITGYHSNEILKKDGNTRDPLVLTCTVSGGNPEPSLTWNGACSMIGTTASSIVTSSVQIDRSINQRSCTCGGTQTHTSWTRQKDVIFTVHFGPDEILITTNLDVLVEGNTVAVTCESTEANPAKSITWYRNGVVMLVDSDYSHTTGMNYGTVTSQTWSKQLIWQDNGSVIECKTQNHMHQDISNTTQLNVEYGAKETTIGVPSDVSEGDGVTVTCSCHSNPNPAFEITRPTDVTVNSDRLVIRNISRTDAGSYTCEAGNKYSRDTRTATMVVKYPPDATVSYGAEGDTGVTFTCQASGIPQTYNFGLWKHIAPDRETVIRELQGDQNGDQYTLILNNVTYEDSGYYQCTVNNGVQGRSTHLDQTKLSEYIIIEGPPIILEQDDSVHSELGDAVNIEVSFYSVPEYTSVTWYGMNGHLSQTVNATHVQTTFYGESVIVAGYVTTLKFDSVIADEFISYRVMLNNTRGSASFVKTLRGINVPCEPESETFTVVAINKQEIKISWTGGCNGGAEQKLYIEYKKSSTEEWTLAHEITEYQDGGNYAAKISGLDPGTEYDIRIWAKNVKGQSDYLHLSSETLAEETEAVSSSAVAGAVVGTLVAVIVVVGVILIVLWRRGMLPNIPLSCTQKQKEATRDVYENHAFDTGATVENNNDAVYQQLGPSENPMIHYEVLSQHRHNSERTQEYETPSAANDDTQYQQLHFNKDPSHGDNDVEYVNTTLN